MIVRPSFTLTQIRKIDLYPRYCIHCAEEFPSDDLRVITFEHNPYEQDEDGGLHCICLACLREEDESSK